MRADGSRSNSNSVRSYGNPSSNSNSQIVIHHYPTTHPQIFQEVHLIQFLHHLEDQLVEVLPLVEEAHRLDPLADPINEIYFYYFHIIFSLKY